MNIQLFQKLSAFLLKKHYGLELNDTRLSETEYTRILIQSNVRPFEDINGHAKDNDFDRIDVKGSFGYPPKVPLTEQDETKALMLVNGLQLLGDQPMTCPLDGARSDFDELGQGRQIHRCLNAECGNEFIAEEDACKTVDAKDVQRPDQYNFNVDASTDKFEIKVDTVAGYGYFEHHTRGDNCGGGLLFEGLELTDYDGVTELPKNVANALRLKGFVVTEDFADFPAEATQETPVI